MVERKRMEWADVDGDMLIVDGDAHDGPDTWIEIESPLSGNSLAVSLEATQVEELVTFLHSLVGQLAGPEHTTYADVAKALGVPVGRLRFVLFDHGVALAPHEVHDQLAGLKAELARYKAREQLENEALIWGDE